MDRRRFLWRSACLLVGSLMGAQSFSKAFANPEGKNKTCLQPHIALIIDDIGYSFCRATQFLEIDVPITFAILPRLPYSYDLASEIRGVGQEIMLHQPMEPYNPNLDPGPGALYVGDRTKRVVRVMEENISALPFAVGVNNHMGSRFTASQKEMNNVLPVIRERGLFFIDSLTTSRSMAYRTAKKLHMAAAYRNVFLDNRPRKSTILYQLHNLRKHALTYGRAVGIGHPFPETARAIRRFIRAPRNSDISFVHASNLVRST